MSRGHSIVKKFLQKRGAWDNNPYKPTTTSATTKSTTPVTGHAFNEAEVRVIQPAYNPRPGETIIGSTNGVENMNSKAQYVANGAVMQKKPQTKQIKTISRYQGKNLDTPNTELKAMQIPVKTVNSFRGKNVGEAVVTTKTNKDASTEINRLGHQAGTGIRAGSNIVDKSGAIHSPMSRARHLARLGMQQMLKLNPKIGESWSDAVLDQLDEVHPAVMAMARVGANKALKAKADQHTELALAANKAGDDAKVKFHQAQVAKLKAQMQKEAVTYTGMGTDVVDKKKKLNPQPNLMMKPKQVKDFKEETIAEGKMKDIHYDLMRLADKKGYSSHKQFTPADYDELAKPHGISGKELAVALGHKKVSQVTKEENLDELKASTLQSYSDKAHQQALDATYDAAHLNRSGEEKFKADAKKLAAKRAGGVQRAQTKLDKMGEALEWPHSAGDIVRCTKTQRLACVQSVENDQYTVVYADGSTETGPADYWTQIDPVNEARVVEQPRGWNVKHLKPAGHGIVGKKVRSYDFPGMHDSHYIEGHVTDEDPQSYHIRTTKVVRHHKEEPISSHMMHIRAPKGMSLFGGAPGVYYAPREQKPAAKPSMRTLRSKK
jgi:hypothetical protein